MRWRTAADRGPESRMLRRIRWKLVAWSAASTLLVLLVLGGAVYVAIARQLQAESEDRLRQRAAVMVQSVPHAVAGVRSDGVERFVALGSRCAEAPSVDGPDGSAPAPASASPAASPPAAACPLTLSVSTTSGQVERWTLPASIVADPSLPGVLIGGSASGTIAMLSAEASGVDVAATSGFQELDVQGTPMRVLTMPIDLDGRTLQLQVAQDRTVEMDTLRSTLLVLVVGGALAVVAAGAVGYRYSGRALVPIQESLRHQREFAADASHELRTPLTVIRSNVAALRGGDRAPDEREMLEDIDAEADRMARLVDQLLLLARTDSGAQEVERRSVDLAEEAADALEPLVRVADARRVAVELDVEPTPLEGDPTRLRQLVAILVDNAIRHAPERGHVWVGVTAATEHATLTVDDDGPGVRVEDRPRVFDRFWRAPDAPAGGSGLGLAIASWIVDRHGGTIRVTDRVGGGARFEVRLPTG